jgi:hypothetical protein
VQLYVRDPAGDLWELDQREAIQLPVETFLAMGARAFIGSPRVREVR